MQADNQQIVHEMSMNALRSATHVVLLELPDSIADRGFDLSLCFHARIIPDRAQPEQGIPAAGRGQLAFVEGRRSPNQFAARCSP